MVSLPWVSLGVVQSVIPITGALMIFASIGTFPKILREAMDGIDRDHAEIAEAIAAAEEARRDAEAAAAAAARAAAAASAAEALMMAEARRLRERRKELYSRGKDAEFAPARAASLEMDDAPLMASYSSLPDTSLAAARQAAEDFGRDVLDSEIDAAWHRSSETPEKPPLRVSASLASPSPVKPPKLPVAGGPREPVQYDPSRRPGEDARARLRLADSEGRAEVRSLGTSGG